MGKNTNKLVRTILGGAVGVLLILFLSFSVSGFFINETALADSPGAPAGNPSGNGGQTGGGGGGEEDISCAVEKIGWIVCPLIEQTGRVGDTAFQFLADKLLVLEPELIATDGSGNSKGAYGAWELARNIANVMFVIAFLVIIMSQVTGMGLNNYGIKKMLPRLIIAAIAVNVSYFICQAMVDLSNILGYETKNFLVGIASEVTDRAAMPPAKPDDKLIDFNTSGGTLTQIAIVALAATTAVWLILSMMVPAIGAIVAAVIAMIVILLMRKAFVILFVVISPIAFVMYLLPNTEQFYKKWLSMFWKLLMVFPVVGLLFGAGQLASSIILVAGKDSETYKDASNKCIELPRYDADAKERVARGGDCSGNSTPLSLGLIAALIAVAPLFAVWPVLKSALSGAGAIGAKISGTVETVSGKAGSKVQERTNRTALVRGMEARKAIRKNYQDQKFAEKMGRHGRSGSFTRIAARGFQGNVGRAGIAPKSWQEQDNKLSAQFAGAQEKIEDQELHEKTAELKHKTGGDMSQIKQEFINATLAGDELGAKAAESMLHGMGASGTDQWIDAMKQVEEGINGKKIGKQMAEALQQHTRLKHGNIKGTSVAVDSWATDNPGGNRSLTSMMTDPANFNNLSADHMMGQSKLSLAGIQASMATADPIDKAKIMAAADAATRSQGYSKVKVGNQAYISSIAQGSTTPPGAPPPAGP